MCAVCNGRSGRSEDNIALFKNFRIFFSDLLLEGHCLAVVSVIVAGAESVVSEEDTSLYLVAEAFASGSGNKFAVVSNDIGTMTVLDAVVSGKVGGSLSGGNKVICSNCILQ